MTDIYPDVDPLAQGYDLAAFYSQRRPNNVSSQAYEALHNVKYGEGLLFGFSVYNSKGSAQFLQIFDLARAPVAGDVPAVVFTMAAASNFGANWIPPRTFRTGCWIANSSTGPTYTAGTNDCFYDVQFL